MYTCPVASRMSLKQPPEVVCAIGLQWSAFTSGLSTIQSKKTHEGSKCKYALCQSSYQLKGKIK